MDVARALYRDMTGQPVLAGPPDEGRKWMVEDMDLVSAFRSWREGTLTLRAWAASLRGVHERACFALDDPLPFFAMGVADCCELFQWFRRKRDTRKQAQAKTGEMGRAA
jgi:predicted ATP-grasp superfamily ATP-dependent carboligase